MMIQQVGQDIKRLRTERDLFTAAAQDSLLRIQGEIGEIVLPAGPFSGTGLWTQSSLLTSNGVHAVFHDFHQFFITLSSTDHYFKGLPDIGCCLSGTAPENARLEKRSSS